jgi:geranylgeranyl reductase family protein
MIEVAIVGGGPAGAYCAYKLAEKGIYPTIFDHSHPREKPCGGLISPLAQELFQFLKKLPIEHVKREMVHFVSPLGRKFSINMKRKEVICVSRLEFDLFLLNMAIDKGAEWRKERVVEVKREGKIWKIKTDKNVYSSKKIVGADGVNSIVRRKVTKPLKAADKGICYGYFAEGLEDEVISFHFLPQREGYIWIIPRKKNASVGIGCTEISHLSQVKKELDTFIQKKYPKIKIVSKWTALIPNIKKVETFCSPVAGSSWILIGDAAGHVNPINGEGMLYALLDGELAALAIIEGDMRLYEKLWRHVYGLNLLIGIKLRKWVYRRFFLECYCRYLKIAGILKQILK